MYINVLVGNGGSTLQVCDQEDFTSFKVVATRGADAADDLVAQELARLGRQTEEGVLIPPGRVIELAGRGEDPEWQARFQQMLDVAAKYGWVHPDGSVQAHVEIRTA